MVPLQWITICCHLLLTAASAAGPAEPSACQAEASRSSSLLQKHLAGSQVDGSEHGSPGSPSPTVPSSPVADTKLALMTRARSRKLNRSDSASLDTSVSSKFIDDIADGFESIGDGFEDLGDTFEDIGEGIADVGLTVGSAVGNAATVVGNSVVEAAESTVDALPNEIKDAASTFGNAVVATGSFVADVGEIVADSAVDLAGDALEVAEFAVQQGAKVGSALGNRIVDAANAIGDGVEKVGALAVGLAKEAWEQIKAFINCLLEGFSLCKLMLDDVCDCDAGSSISMSTSGLSMRCVFKDRGTGFSSGYGFSAAGAFEMGDKSSNGRIKLPGQAFIQSFKPQGDELKARQVGLKHMKSKAPSGSCERNLDLALEGVVQFAPILEISVKTNGDTEVAIEGLARASLDGLISAEGSCAFIAEKRFPKVPKTKVVCGPFFCIAIMLQMVAEVELKGVLTGSVEVSASTDFRIHGKVLINPAGKADVDFDLPSIEQKHGFGFAASASGSTRIGMGPNLVIFPMPGVPVSINPMMNAELRAQGTLNMPSSSLLQEAAQHELAALSQVNSSRANQIPLCGAAALNIYTDIEIQGFGIPVAFTASLSFRWLQEEYYHQLIQGAEVFVRFIAGDAMCIPGAESALDLIMSAARAAASALTSLIPDLSIDFSTPSMTLLEPTKLFCLEAVKSPGFENAHCSQDLGCKSTGRPTSPMVTPVPPGQVMRTTKPSAYSPTCHSIPMGDRFIQLGDWRWAAIDDTHLSVSHKDGQTAQIYRSDGTLHPGPRTSYNAWGRSIGPAKGIDFGFQFIQIGKFRLGAVNDEYFTVSHRDGMTVMIFKSDGTAYSGWTDHSTYDRPLGAASGITFGDKFIQIGQFRIGEGDGQHSLVTHSGGQTIQVFRGDGTNHWGPRTDWSRRINDRLPVPWTCQSLEEMAHGTCDRKFGTFGDRFIQLGDWRLAAIDDTHFSISHKDGQTAQIYRSDGTLHPGPRTSYNAWHRPIGFAYGIAFGSSFIQIGLFRLGMVDDNHLSISHKWGSVSQVFRGDGTLHPGPRSDYDLWKVRSTGPAAGITFGDRFLQIGRFRLGDADGWHMTLTHEGGQTIQIFRGDGTLHPGPRTDWTHPVGNRYPKWHCGNIQLEFGTCTGITVGGRFLQLGDWRLAAVDNTHFSFSHRDGQTAQIARSDGYAFDGPRTDYNVWGWEAGLNTNGGHPNEQVALGDHFIQFGQWRLGQVNDQHLSLSHSAGQTIQIWHGAGTLHPGPRTDFNLWWKPLGEPVGVTFGDRFVQIGQFRIGDVDSKHFSVSHVSGKTAQLFLSDGSLRSGPRTDFTTFGRPLQECLVIPP
ncbi:unnamed protein product [Symbiodinium pilosum]|uniref:Uncharacterized protein n=1 Tax=Symbiodinium pilosum TaxID=2952 RepID=A0A812W9W4_SYMPI|nr:unnamed protein product [Symbiodinium pilosum]